MDYLRKFRGNNILVTSALPYANGQIHLGHLVEYIQTDIWIRTLRMIGAKVYYMCADDAHGTAIMLAAEKAGVSEQDWIDKIYQEHQADINSFEVFFDNFYTTHSEENRQLSIKIYQELFSKGYILEKEIEQLYDTEKNIFLSDRYVKGGCPKCQAPDQYGDNCEVCGATYNAVDLVESYSTLSQSKPEVRKTDHLFFDLPQFENFLNRWLQEVELQSEVVNKLREWFNQGLKQWDITRDKPYFGFEIPDRAGKYFYVWLDAPIGYFVSLLNYLKNNNDLALFDKFTRSVEEGADKYQMYHFIGKDIAYFHTLFWPAMLEGAGLKKPDGVFTHGFLTVNGAKMSKSRGTFIEAKQFAKVVEPELLRYYFASRLTDSQRDLDLNFEDFVQKINSDLIGKYANIASRTSGFITKRFAGKLADEITEATLVADVDKKIPSILQFYGLRDYSSAIREIVEIADNVNRFISEKEPWKLAKIAEKQDELQQVCSLALIVYYKLSLLLSPVLPKLTARALQQFDCIAPFKESDIFNRLTGLTLKPFKPLLNRLEASTLNALLEGADNSPIDLKANPTEDSTQIGFEDFAKLDFRLGLIQDAKLAENTDKIIHLLVDVGEAKPRNIFSSIRGTYHDPEKLIGKKVPVLLNLKPKKFKFGVSEGMLIFAPDRSGLYWHK